MIKKTLSIAGFDGSGGAGIQADLKTFSALGCYGMTVLTALPVQNTQGVKTCYELPLRAIEEQLQTIFEDIEVDAIKIGMLFNCEIIECVAKFLQQHAKHIPIIVDPVMVAKSGHALLQDDAVAALSKLIFPLSCLITPNLPEAETLLHRKITNLEEMQQAAKQLLNFDSQYVLLKGGHLQHQQADDLLVSKDFATWYPSERINTQNTHGTGCTLSAAITAFIARDYNMAEAVAASKKYITHAIAAAKDQKIGKGHGPVHHFHEWW